MLKSIYHSLYKSAEKLNTRNICTALSTTGPHPRLLDVGCNDGVNTQVWAQAATATTVYGIEPVKSVIPQAKKNHIRVLSIAADQGTWPLDNNSIDCIVSNQVIEHLSHVDHFISECHRVLVSGGTVVTSTPNLASWHNIAALTLGWAPFDLANSSQKSWGIGNPLSAHTSESDPRGGTWTHKCVYTSRWLAQWFELYGFKHLHTYGSGYYPFPAELGQIDVNHGAFMTLVGRKI